MPQRRPLAETALPQYQVIAAELLATEIASGRRGPGTPFPSVRDIADAYGVAQGTAAHVVRHLREQGHIERAPVGTRVASQPTASSPGERLARIMSGGVLARPGETPYILAADLRPATEDVRTRLGLDTGAYAGCREYLIMDRAERPVAYGVSWFHPDLWRAVPELREREPIPAGAIDAIRRATGRMTVAVPPMHEARIGTGPEVRALEQPDGSPVLVVVTECLDAADTVLEYSVVCHPPGYRVA